MKTVIKSLFVWFLLLAVPFQGFASATMLLCAPMQSTAPDAAVATTPASSHDHAAMLAASSAGQEHHATDASAPAAEAGDASSAGHHASGKCNSCATCCFGASMPPSHVNRVLNEALSFPVLAFDAGSVPAVDLALPERPPKSSLT